MIPLAFIQQWTASAPWSDLRQVEQDLIISRALCDLFTSPALRDRIAFRGGTAIHKLLFQRPLRYSEDIDLVQTRAEPIGTSSMGSGTHCHGWANAAERRPSIRFISCSSSPPKQEAGSHSS